MILTIGFYLFYLIAFKMFCALGKLCAIFDHPRAGAMHKSMQFNNTVWSFKANACAHRAFHARRLANMRVHFSHHHMQSLARAGTWRAGVCVSSLSAQRCSRWRVVVMSTGGSRMRTWMRILASNIVCDSCLCSTGIRLCLQHIACHVAAWQFRARIIARTLPYARSRAWHPQKRITIRHSD